MIKQLLPFALLACVATQASAGVLNSSAPSAKTYPSIGEYLMPTGQEIALARTAAPANVSGQATIKVLTPKGFVVAEAGTNGFVCMVMRAFSAPTYTPAQFLDLVYDPSVRAPICFNSLAAKQVLPYYELRTDLALKGNAPDRIQAGVEEALRDGQASQADGSQLRVYVVRGTDPRTRHRPLAPAHDGVLARPRQRRPRQQRVRFSHCRNCPMTPGRPSLSWSSPSPRFGDQGALRFGGAAGETSAAPHTAAIIARRSAPKFPH